MNRLPRVVRFMAFGVMAVIFLFLFGYVTMWLWNWLMPWLFHLPTLTYWQAVGVMILSRLLLGGFRGPGGHGWSGRRARERMMERWASMSEEEREKFRQRMRGGVRDWCGFEPPPPAAPKP